MVYSGVLLILFCTVIWFDVEGLNIEVEGQTSEVGSASLPRAPPHFNHSVEILVNVTSKMLQETLHLQQLSLY